MFQFFQSMWLNSANLVTDYKGEMQPLAKIGPQYTIYLKPLNHIITLWYVIVIQK